MEDAATVDGEHGQTFFYVMLPLVKPAFLAIGVLSFQGNWNNFEGPLPTDADVPAGAVISFFQQSLSLECRSGTI